MGQWLACGADRAGPRRGWPLVTVLQRAENLADRQAAEAVRTRIDWQYLLGLPLDDPGFDHTVLAEFRARVAGGGLEQVALDALLARLAAEGLVKAGGKQRTDSTHVVAAVAALNRLQLAGEAVRAALEALMAAHPDWVAQRVCVPDFARRYGKPVTSWRPPVSQSGQDELAIAYARDGYALLEAVYDSAAPGWPRAARRRGHHAPAASHGAARPLPRRAQTPAGPGDWRRKRESEHEPEVVPSPVVVGFIDANAVREEADDERNGGDDAVPKARRKPAGLAPAACTRSWILRPKGRLP